MNKTSVLLRFADLKDRGIARNREQLRCLISDHGFPRGFLLTPNARVYDETAVEAWLDSRRRPAPREFAIEAVGA